MLPLNLSPRLAPIHLAYEGSDAHTQQLCVLHYVHIPKISPSAPECRLCAECTCCGRKHDVIHIVNMLTS